jgi:hypothetical protein
MTVVDIIISAVVGGVFGYFGGMLAAYVLKRHGGGWGR